MWEAPKVAGFTRVWVEQTPSKLVSPWNFLPLAGYVEKSYETIVWCVPLGILTDKPFSLTGAFGENTYPQETLDPWPSIKRTRFLVWRDNSSAVENTCCPYRRPEFDSLAPTSGSSQLLLTLALGDPEPSGFYSHLCSGTHTHTEINTYT